MEKAKVSAEESAQAAAADKVQLEKQKNMLSNLASLGILAAAFGHESVDWAGNIVKLAVQLDEDVIAKAWWIAEAERPVVQQKMKFLVSESKKLRKFAQFTLGNITRDKRAKKKDVLRRSLDTVFAARLPRSVGGRKKDTRRLSKGRGLLRGGIHDGLGKHICNLIINAAWPWNQSG